MSASTCNDIGRRGWSVLFVSLVSASLLALPAGARTQEDSEPAVDQNFSTSPVHSGRKTSNSTAVKAVDAALQGKPDAASELARQSGDPAAVKLVEWLNVTENWKAVGYDRIVAFIDANPGWPSQQLLNQRAEWLLFTGKPAAEAVLRHFANRSPVSAEGRIALARALTAKGDTKRARAVIAEAWADTGLPSAAEKAILGEFRPLLSHQHLEARVWRLIHAHRVSPAIEAAKHVSADHVDAARAAAELIRDNKAGLTLYNKLPAAMRNQRALLYALARYYRRTDQIDKARDMLLKAPSDHAQLVDPEAWWIERRLIVRQSLGIKNKKHWPAAYKLAAAHGFSSGEHHSEGEFLAGWIALRLLNDPRTAVRHFGRIGENAATRTEASRGYYWTGRAWLALGDKAKAEAAFRAAAESPTLYYGQLALEALGRGDKAVKIRTGNPSAAVRAAVEKDELVRAFRLLADAGVERHLGLFLWPLAARCQTPDEAAVMAAIVAAKAGPYMTVRFAKAAASYGADIDDWGYPHRTLPDWKKLGNPVERAVILGLARQESEFNDRAMSHAGARGLMQLMPGTAKLVARQHKVSYNEKKLTSDPAYNVMLGAAHFGDLVASYRGSYILSLVAYNAGPRRVREWIEVYGDPRKPEVDPIDWVESVPFTETRKYIQKVLQNVHVYRSRLDPKSALPMTHDLARGGAPMDGVTTVAGDGEDGACGVTAASIAALISSC